MENFNKSITVTILIVLLIFFLLWAAMVNWYPIPSTASEFGDSFGGLNTLFSALAFAFLIVTVVMQKNELQLQRQEISNTREELKKSALAQDSSQKALNIQVRIMAKQAMLASYQSLYQAYLPTSTSMKADSRTKKNALANCKKYIALIEQTVTELEKEQELFADPLLFEKIKALYNEEEEEGNKGNYAVR
ncbi:hypothetical protein [Euzebyella saccharophila]|uniref:Uncharacterized protein n=1 Tax=Euzebyella saccharophila TaxID=679664 RepID=A0ABV8JN40_9FLAO|nr:hypothetical protein [Euzebyella saccharophila]